jgi:hypothetical protein
MQDTYRLRNSIVHDGDPSRWLRRTGKQPVDVIVFVNTAEEYLREALKKRCWKPQNKESPISFGEFGRVGARELELARAPFVIMS